MAPEVPTSAEAGLPAYQATTWTPWSTTLGTPLPIRQFLYEQIAEALRVPAVRDRLLQLGNTIPEGMTPERPAPSSPARSTAGCRSSGHRRPRRLN